MSTTRRCCRHIAMPATVPPRRASCARSAGCLWDAGKRDQAEARYAEAAALARRRGCADRAGASLAGTRPAGVSHGRPRAGGKVGGRGARLRTLAAAGRRCRRSGARPRWRLPRRSTPRVSRSPGSGATARRCARSSEASRWPRRPACRARPAAATPISACSIRRSIRRSAIAVCRRGLEVATPHRRSRFPGAASRQSGGRLLHVHRPLLRGGRACRRKGDRDRPRARPARAPRGAVDRARPDPPVPRPARTGGRASTTRRSRWRAKPASRSCCFRAMMGLRRSTSTSTTWQRPNAILPWRRRYAPSTGSTPEALVVLPFLD